MSRKRPIPLFEDILTAMDRATAFAAPHTFESFEADVQAQYAVIRALEIVGEAARRMGPDVHARFPVIPWRGMIGLRNVLIHQYDEAEVETIWAMVHVQIPATRPLVEAALHVLRQEEAPS